MTDRDKMDEAIELVKRGHCVGAVARDASGAKCSPLSPDATSFCALGACFRAARGRMTDALWAEAEKRGAMPAALNDSSPTPAVLDFMRAARGRL